MKGFMFLCPVAIAIAGSIGCAGHYWECKAGKAGVFNQPIPYQQTTGPIGVSAVGAVGLESRHAVYGPAVFAEDQPAELLAAPRLARAVQARRVVSGPSDCTMQELCELMRALAQDRGLVPKDRKPMPRSEE